MSNQLDITKFEFVLTLEGHIICQRFFNVKDHVEQARRSMDLHYYVKNLSFFAWWYSKIYFRNYCRRDTCRQ